MQRSSWISLALLLAAAPASAQTAKPAKPLPIMRGAVQDTLGRPLEGAQVEVLGLDRTVTTPASGAYRVDEIKPGKSRRVFFRRDPLPHFLRGGGARAGDPRGGSRYRDFVWRSHSTFGHFL